MNYYARRIEDVLKELGTEKNGLTKRQVEKRIKEFGPNKIDTGKKINIWKIFLEQFTDFLILVLIAAAVLSFGLGIAYGDETYLFDGGLIVLIVLMNGLFGFFQNYKAEKSLEELEKMAVVKARVIRDGKVQEINAEELVPGDIILIEEGDEIPADARIIESSELVVDEAVLTGESLPMRKNTRILEGKTSLAERRNMVFTNTFVCSGNAKAVVALTGMRTEIGKIAKELKKVPSKPTLFQIELDKMGKKVGQGIIIIVLCVMFVQFFMGSADIITIILTAIALGVAAIPEGLPAVVTVALALGTRVMAKKNALVRKLSVVEGLSSVDIICTDKTGTLTESRLIVREIYADLKKWDAKNLPKDNKVIKKLLLAGALCNNAVLGEKEGKKEYLGDPTEIAILRISENLVDVKGYEQKGGVPFTSERKMMSTIHKKEKECFVFSKGAPEVILSKCSYIEEGGSKRKLTSEDKEKILKKNNEFAGRGRRVLGFAYKQEKVAKKDAENNLVFLGLEAMVDPPRVEVKGAIEACKTAGIKVIMLTGDNILTAKAIAKEIGIEGGAMEGKEIEELADKELKSLLKKVGIFARVSPLQKLRVLEVLQEMGHRVAMTGDGVNDAPGLKNAHVGIAMGIRGTEITKQASDMVILDDNFATIVTAVKEGRRVFDNIRNFVNYMLTSNFSEVMVVFIASLAGYLPIKAAQLLWINLLTDGLPAVVLGTDPAQEGIMRKPPRDKREGIINRRVVYSTLSIGMLDTVLLLGLFFYFLNSGIELASTVVFTFFVLSETIRMYVIRKQGNLGLFSNKLIILAMAGSVGLQLVVLYTPLGGMFGVVPLGIEEWKVMGIFLAVGHVLAMIMVEFFLKEETKTLQLRSTG